MKAKSSLRGALSISVAVLVLCGCNHRHRATPLRLGDEWLSWKPEQRQLYVGGFLDGQGAAQMSLCNDFKDSIDQTKLHGNIRLDVDETPCEHFRHRYTHSEAGSLDAYTHAYVSVIDDFYKHPECRMLPYSTLMWHLDDKEYRSGEDLFQAVQMGSVNFGFFSGFDGIEKCYGSRAPKK